MGLVRRTRFGQSCEEAVAALFQDLPPSAEKRLFSVDAGIATVEQFAAATEHDALVGRLRKNVVLRRAPRPRRRGQRGRPPVHGPVLHPGATRPEGRADEDTTLTVEDRQVRVRRWNTLHFARAPKTVLDVVRVDDPVYKRPLLIGTTARELTTDGDAASLWAPLAGGDQLLCGAGHLRDGEAARLDRHRRQPPDQPGLAVWVGAQSDRRRVPGAADGALGPQSRQLGGALGESSGPPCPAFCRPCPARGGAEKVSVKWQRLIIPRICSSHWLLELVKPESLQVLP